MTDHDVRDFLERMAAEEPTPFLDAAPLTRRARRRAARTVIVGAVGVVAAIAVLFTGVAAIRSTSVPANDPTPTPAPSDDLGIFAPVAGRIVYGDRDGIWGVDPTGPADPETRVQLTPEAGIPLGWSSDGTRLLIMQTIRGEQVVAEGPGTSRLVVLHADGSETQVAERQAWIPGATISPDGSRVVFATYQALYSVDVDGGRPVLLLEGGEDEVYAPTFSPDGAKIAYVVGSGDHSHRVSVMNADGSDAHQILANDTTRGASHVLGLAWSPADDRIAFGNDVDTYTFAPDGSGFTQVLTDGTRPYWSPDGSQLAYSPLCLQDEDGCSLAIADVDTDGSDARVLGFARSGPWHPGAIAAPEDEDVPAAAIPADEVLWLDSSKGDDLLAVDATTGEERVLVEDIEAFRGAMRSADGRWVAYERWSGSSPSLWVVGPELEPRKVIDLPDESVLGAWAWSSTGSRLAADSGSRLHVIDPATGLVTDLASMASVDSPPAWSPDGTRIALGTTGGTIYSVDVGTGERSVLAELPGEDLDTVDAMEWSPDGSRLAVFVDVEPGTGRLFVLNADGSDIRVVAEEELVIRLDWSPDGSRIVFAADAVEAPRIDIWVAHADGTPASLVASPGYSGYQGWGSPVWSPDGSQIGYSVEPNHAFAIGADGSGDAAPIDDLTYASWSGGSFCWQCLWWINHPVSYTGPSEP